MDDVPPVNDETDPGNVPPIQLDCIWRAGARWAALWRAYLIAERQGM
jgi:hypothetical protein